MFWTAVKVLFIRQMYGFKHRWFATAFSVLFPLLLLGLVHIGRQGFKGLETTGYQIPLEIVVMPFNSDTQGLINEAHHILRNQDDFSVSHLRVVFKENAEQMNQSLEHSEWPSIGVQFQEVSPDKLEYTLHPAIAPRKLNLLVKFYSLLLTGFSNDGELSHIFLQLQAAIDAAFVRKNCPGCGYLRLRRFPDSPNFMGEGQRHNFAGMRQLDSIPLIVSFAVTFYSAHFVSVGIMMLMWLLAFYIVKDKLSGVRELLCISGVPRWMVSISWLFTFCLLGIVVALCQLTLLTLPPSDPLLAIAHPFLLAILLVIYLWSSLVFSSLVANLFASQRHAGLVIMLYWTFSILGSTLAALALRNYRVAQAFVSILPNFGYFMFMIIAIMEFFTKDTVLSFGNLFSSSVEYISAGLVLLMMLVSMFILLTLAIYMDAVKPGPYGRARPWYLMRRRDNLATVRPADAAQPDDAIIIQGIKGGVPIGIKCVDIVKVYGTYKALNNVNLNIVKNSITILLGQNGAGKTTLFSILCGILSPTSGDVYTEKYNIFKGNNIIKFRQVLGYCPQENLLIDELTVQEHLIIFGMLKGLRKSEALKYSDEWTAKFDMSSTRYTLAKNLSGGSKRKLCLAIAMTGDPQYLLLDEPSAGMDVESTRKFCDLVLKEKGNCTVVISTHNMDEAGLLGDHIAILAHGNVKCYGDQWFLKRMLDTGCRLTCNITSTRRQDVINAVTRYIEGARVIFKAARSVTFLLPSSMMQYIPNLLHMLEVQFGDTLSANLSPSNLDDVYIKVQKDLGVKIDVEDLPSIQKDEMSPSCCNVSQLFWRRAEWMMSKKIITMILLVFLLPALAMIGNMFLLYMIISSGQSNNVTANNLVPSSADPIGQFALISSQHDNVSDIVRTALMKSGISFKEMSNPSNYTAIDAADNELLDNQSKLLFALDTHASNAPIAYFPSRAEDSVSSAYSALVNALLQGNTSIITHLSFFWNHKNFQDIICPIDPIVIAVCSALFSEVIALSFMGVSVYFVFFPYEEKTTLFKHLLLLTDLQPAVYWLANLLFDMLIYASSCALLLTIMAIIDHLYTNVFFNSHAIWALILVLVLYGLSSIMYWYLVSGFIYQNASRLLLIIFIVWILPNIVLLSVLITTGYISKKFAYFSPHVIFKSSVVYIVNWVLFKKNCDQCNHGCQYLEDNALFEGLKDELISFSVLTIGFFLILMFLDHGLGRRLLGVVQQCCFGRIEDLGDDVDPEVGYEKQRVDNLKIMDEDKYPLLVCDGLGKKYSCRRTAVYDVTFASERGECFGLLGVNGSGKTTTFGMLAASLCVSKGTATIEGQWSLTDCEYTYMKRVGYCPQYGGLLKELSARTILRLFGRLSGVHRDQIEPLIDKWINILDMNGIAKRPCGQYSGGNKRKLSLAIALIANKPVILLDEPTAGVDPVVRRRIWKILTTSLEKNEQTIILSSHTMSECEAICDRLTIMVKGVMKCLGPVPVLKRAFGKSYALEVKFSPHSTVEQQEVVQSMIEAQFARYIELEQSLLNGLKFILETDNVKLYDLFAAMLKIKSMNPVIEDFTLSDTPLEQVFLKFAQSQ